MAAAEICAANVIQEVVAVTFCDTKACGECGVVSDGCQRLFALVLSAGGSPGLGSQVVYSPDGGLTCGATPITTLPANQDPDDFACMGEDLVVVSEDSISHHYADRELILLGTPAWVEVPASATGYVAAGAPRCIWAISRSHCWIGGLAGHVYFLDNPADEPVVQSAGTATMEDLNDIHAYDEENGLAVGDDGAVIYTLDGETWVAATGPVGAGVNLTCCWMKSPTEWWHQARP